MMKFDPKQREKKNRSDDKEGTINPCREICWDSVSNGRDGAQGKFVNGGKSKGSDSKG